MRSGAALLIVFVACGGSGSGSRSDAPPAGGFVPAASSPDGGAPVAAQPPEVDAGPVSPPPESDAGTPDPVAVVDAGTPEPDAGLPPPEPPPDAGTPTRYALPLYGTQGRDWAIMAYMDEDPASGSSRDYRGGDRAYDGHRGTDFGIADYRAMDLGYPIHAIAPGVVAYVDGTNLDRDFSRCPGMSGNGVVVHQDDTRSATYWHMRHDSIPPAIQVGSHVEAGDVLGLVGSTGCATWPHLHLELEFENDPTPLDPFLLELWDVAPLYDTPFQLMAEPVLRRGEYTSSLECADPAPTVTSYAAGDTLGLCFIVSGGVVGDRSGVRYLRPDGFVVDDVTTWFGPPHGPAPHMLSRALDRSGTWGLEYLINGVVAWTGSVTVR